MKCYKYVNSSNLCNNLKTLLLPLFYRWGNWGREQLRNLPTSYSLSVVKPGFAFRLSGSRNLTVSIAVREELSSTSLTVIKAMVFPVVMYGCESWTIKKAECWRIDTFKLWGWRRLLRVPERTARRSNRLIPKKINPEYSLEGLMLKLQYLGHLMWRATSLEKTLMLGKIEGQMRRGWQRMRWLDSITDSVDMNLSNLWETVENRAAWHPAVHGVTDQTWLRSWTATLTWKTSNCLFLLFPFVYPHIVPQLTHLFHSHPTSSAHSPKLHLDGQIIYHYRQGYSWE